jgi:hypothetical protein
MCKFSMFSFDLKTVLELEFLMVKPLFLRLTGWKLGRPSEHPLLGMVNL